MKQNYIFINAKENKVEVVELDLTAKGSYKTIQKVLGVDLFTVAPTLQEDLFFYVDDEGLINGTNDFFIVDGLSIDWLAGNALIVSHDEDGKTFAPKFQLGCRKVHFGVRNVCEEV